MFCTLQGAGLALVAKGGSRFAVSIFGLTLEAIISVLGFPLFYLAPEIAGLWSDVPSGTNGFLLVAAANAITWASTAFIILALLARFRRGAREL
jgi:hypothetical protein